MGAHILAHFFGLFILAAGNALPELPTAAIARRLVTPSESQTRVSPPQESIKEDAAALTIWILAAFGVLAVVVLLSVFFGNACWYRVHSSLGENRLSFDRLIFDELPGRELSLMTAASLTGPSVDDAFAGPQSLSLLCPSGHDFEVVTGDPPDYRGPTSCARCKRGDLARNCQHFMHCPQCKYDVCPDCLPLKAARGQRTYVHPLRHAIDIDDIVVAQSHATQAASTDRAAALRVQANMATQQPTRAKPAWVASSRNRDERLDGGDPQPQLQTPLTQQSSSEVSISSSGPEAQLQAPLAQRSTHEASIKPQLPPLPSVRSAAAPPPPGTIPKWPFSRRSGAGRSHMKTSSIQEKQRRLPRHVHFERPSRQDGLDPGNDPGDEGRSLAEDEESDDRTGSSTSVQDLGACSSLSSVQQEASGDLEEALRIVEATAENAASLLASVEYASPLGKQQILAEVNKLETSEEYQAALRYVGSAHHSDSVFGIDPLGGTLLS